jgi:hypothetical protein
MIAPARRWARGVSAMDATASASRAAITAHCQAQISRSRSEEEAAAERIATNRAAIGATRRQRRRT